MLLLLVNVLSKYFYQMSRNTGTSTHTINQKDSYAILQKPTNATFISKEIMETNEEKTSVRQENKIIYVKSKLAKDKKTKRQEEKKSIN